jgi:hypothetical protein
MQRGLFSESEEEISEVLDSNSEDEICMLQKAALSSLHVRIISRSSSDEERRALLKDLTKEREKNRKQDLSTFSLSSYARPEETPTLLERTKPG